jgi:hypothetical protein
MVIQLAANLDCANQMAQPLAIRPVDFMTLVQTPIGMQAQCAPAASVGVDFGTLRPTMMPAPCLPMYFDVNGTTSQVLGGVATVENAFTQAEGVSCLALGDLAAGMVSCIYPTTSPTLCGTGGELDLGILDFETSAASVNADLVDALPGIVFGSVWDTATKRPIAGATIEILDDAPGEVHYTDLVGIQFQRDATAVATGDRGLFMLYLADPVRIRIKPPNKPAKDYSVAGWSPGTLIAAF